MSYEKDIKHISGKKKGNILMFALSTCMWCKKTKKLLDQLGVDYNYVDVDLLPDKEKTEAEEEIIRWNPSVSFPTIVINDEECIIGFRPEEIKGKIGK